MEKNIDYVEERESERENKTIIIDSRDVDSNKI